MVEQKLKTLKDIEKDWSKRVVTEASIQEAVSSEDQGIEFSMTGKLIPLEIVNADLRQEAIKWVKDIHYKDGQHPKYFDHDVCTWIKLFFNITYRDLQ